MLINICPIKLLYHNKEHISKNKRIAAILCSSYRIDKHDYAWLPNIIIEFDDVSIKERPRAFTAYMAREIRKFIDRLPKCYTLYICCDSGESRSSAIAAATYRYLRKDEMIVWRDPRYHPNLLVYKIQCEAYGIPLSWFQQYRLQRISLGAFRKAIKAGHKKLRH